MGRSETGANSVRGRPARVAGAPPGPRRQDLRRGALLDAAAALFVEQGTAATTIDHIVDRAGVAKGTFYHYFQDRAGMLEALRGRYSQQFEEIASAAIEAQAGRGRAARLAVWIEAVVQTYLATYALHEAIFHDPAICHRCVMGEEPVVKLLAALLEDGVAAGEWDVADPLVCAVCMFSGLHGVVDETIAIGGDAASIVPMLVQLFGNMVRQA